jgi:hypothetical protein
MPPMPDRRRLLPAALVALALLAAPPAAGAHEPGTYGGPADRVCGPAAGRLVTVGATRVSCRGSRRGAIVHWGLND